MHENKENKAQTLIEKEKINHNQKKEQIQQIQQINVILQEIFIFN